MKSDKNSPELKEIWKDQDSILEKSINLNVLCLEKIQTQRSKSKLNPLLALRLFESFVNIVIIYFLRGFLDELTNSIILFTFLSSVILFSFYSIYLCIKQIIIIIQINFSDNIVEIQKKLSLLQTHILDYFRLSFLAVPFWILYPVIGLYVIADAGSIEAIPQNWWFANIIFGLMLLPLCIYAYFQVSYKNINKRWVRFFIRNAGGKSVTEASEFLKEIHDFEKV